jgi:DNA polymerase-3 subunit delta'
MKFDRVFGQNRVKRILSASIRRERLAHAHLFYGQGGVGKDALVIDLALGLNCSQKHGIGCGVCPSCNGILRLESAVFHLTLPLPARQKPMNEKTYLEIIRERALNRMKNPYSKVTYTPEISTLSVIGIDQIREIKRKVHLRIGSGKKRIFLISHADRMTPAASNTLLKLLEEPPRGTFIFLTTSYPGHMLDTIVSRCQVMRFSPLLDSEIEYALVNRFDIQEKKAQFFSRMSCGSLQVALTMAEKDYESDRNGVVDFLEKALDEDDTKNMNAVEELLKKRDKIEVKELLRILQAWIRDLLCIKFGLKQGVMNIDKIKSLEEFIKKCPDFNLETAMFSLDQAIDFIEKNVYLNLIVYNLMRSLKQCKNK